MHTARVVRRATDLDRDAIVAVARAHGFDAPDTAVDLDYQRFIETRGRLVVAEVGGAVVGFGGAIDVTGIRFVTDLFVLPEHQASGHGGAMLDALVADADQRMTFSSAHERAAPTYARHGMVPIWNLEYWSGPAPGATQGDDEPTVEAVGLAAWSGDRRELAEHWAPRSARLLRLGPADRPAGWAVVLPAGATEPWTITRLVTAAPHGAALRAVVATVPHGEQVSVCVPDRSPARRVLQQAGFVVTDRDVCCASEGVDLAESIVAVHPGLC